MGGVEDAIHIHLVNVVDADIRRELAGRQIDAIIIGHAQDTLGEAAQGRRIDLVGTAERIDDTGLRAPSFLMVVVFGELVVDRVGTMLASLSSRSQVHAYEYRSTSTVCQSFFHKSCIYVFRAFSTDRPSK